MSILSNTMQSGKTTFEIAQILREVDYDFSRGMAIEYSRGYSKGFIQEFVKYKSIRMAAGFACKWFEREFSEVLRTSPDFSEYVGKLKLSERDRELLKRTLRMIFILKN